MAKIYVRMNRIVSWCVRVSVHVPSPQPPNTEHAFHLYFHQKGHVLQSIRLHETNDTKVCHFILDNRNDSDEMLMYIIMGAAAAKSISTFAHLLSLPHSRGALRMPIHLVENWYCGSLSYGIASSMAPVV